MKEWNKVNPWTAFRVMTPPMNKITGPHWRAKNIVSPGGPRYIDRSHRLYEEHGMSEKIRDYNYVFFFATDAD